MTIANEAIEDCKQSINESVSVNLVILLGNYFYKSDKLQIVSFSLPVLDAFSVVIIILVLVYGFDTYHMYGDCLILILSMGQNNNTTNTNKIKRENCTGVQKKHKIRQLKLTILKDQPVGVPYYYCTTTNYY